MDLASNAGRSVSMLDVLEYQRATSQQATLIEEAAGDSLKVCTFERGYIDQSVYACKTCSENTDVSSAGICRGCAFSCHDDHQLYELFTKRAFKCDCGTSKFKSSQQSKCLLRCEDSPSVTNEKNQYSHNFRGTYCYCDKPYNDATETMFQCVRCEDWFHDTCEKAVVPDGDEEFICRTCINVCDFLMAYFPRKKVEDGGKNEAPTAGSSATDGQSSSGAEGKLEVTKKRKSESGPVPTAVAHSNPGGENAASSAPTESSATSSNASTHACSTNIPESSTSSTSSKGQADCEEKEECYLKKCGTIDVPTEGEGLFFTSATLQHRLCKCSDCLQLYKEKGVEILLKVDELDGDSVNYTHMNADNDKVPKADHDLQHMERNLVEALPRAEVLTAMAAMKTFGDFVKAGLKGWTQQNPGKEVSGDVMKDIVAVAKERVAESRKRKFGL